MSGFSTALANHIIGGTLPSVSYASPASKYLALFFADPTDDNVTTNEVSGAWYARQGTGAWSSAVSGARSNDNTITYSAVTDAAVNVTHWGIYDSLTLGTLLYSGEFATSKTLNIGDVATLAPTDLQITLL